MRTKMFKLTVVVCFCLCGLKLQSASGASFKQAIGPNEPLFSHIPKYLKEDMLLYYSFDEPFRTQLIDLSGNNNNGKVHGVEHRSEGKYGAAGFFNGRDNYVSVENVHLKAFTFTAWVKTSTSGVNNRRIFLFDSGEESFFAVQGAKLRDIEFNTVIRQEDEWEDEGVKTDACELRENVWTHIAVTFDGLRAGIYFDGRLIQMKDIARDGFTGTLTIGGIETHDGELWHGIIDEVAVFERALFAAEVAALYKPTEDNPLVGLKAYCESEQAWSPKLLDILLRVASAMKEEDDVDPNLQSGRGVAHFYQIEKKCEEKDKWEQEEEERIIQFQFKEDSSRSDIFSGRKGQVKSLDWIFVENPEYGIRCDDDDLEIEDNKIGIFHRELGYDMHPDTFNRVYEMKLSEFLYRSASRAKKVGFRPSITINDDGILEFTHVRTAPNDKNTLKVRISIGPPARILSIVNTKEESNDERRNEESFQYHVAWQWHLDQCYVKNVECIEVDTEFDLEKNSKPRRHWYKQQKLDVLAYESRAAVPDRAFTLLGLDLKSDTDIRDKLKKSEYSLDDVLQGKITPGPRYKSLMGATLPSLNLFTNDTIAPLVRNKAVLICFFDMNQRPSRHGIMQLCKQTERLKKKDIAVITIQTPKVDQETLDRWVKKNDVPFPIGMIQGDEEKVCFTWGVKSLPWLILTDKNHVVVAEGFALDELDSKIVQIGAEN